VGHFVSRGEFIGPNLEGTRALRPVFFRRGALLRGIAFRLGGGNEKREKRNINKRERSEVVFSKEKSRRGAPCAYEELLQGGIREAIPSFISKGGGGLFLGVGGTIGAEVSRRGRCLSQRKKEDNSREKNIGRVCLGLGGGGEGKIP